jgi:YidC/Oxa1 family membrane protein insertase
MINILYTLIIFPIEQVIEICFFCYRAWFGSLGFAIIGVSVTVSTFVLPVYLMAEKQQRRQREIEKKLKNGVDLIKSVFKGDERFMLLSTYYRQNNYHPIFALRNSLDLLIQIPFFIAAYRFISDMRVLEDAPFLFITDLGAPDKLLFGLNILPIAMTLINVVSGMIYAKDLRLGDRIQLYLMACVFFVLLYDSPAGLVLYWTSNNIYNLVKNIIQNGLKNRKFKERNEQIECMKIKDNALNDSRAFILSSLAIALLIGLVIPSSVILSGVDEFSYSATGVFISPLRFIVHTILQTGGFFLWGICLYFLFQGKTRVILTIVTVSLLIISIMDTFVFWGDYGILTQDIVLSNYQDSQLGQQYAAIAVIIALSAVTFFLMSIRRKQIIISILFIMVISFMIFGVVDIVKTNIAFANLKKHRADIIKTSITSADLKKYKMGNDGEIDSIEKVFKFSKNGKNIIILIMDMAQSQFLPFIFDEKPDILKSFRGFTYYPNMVSFGGHTCYGAPPLFGGYHYTPYEIQMRAKQPLADKYHESIQIIPRVMAQNGINVSVTNLPFIDPEFNDIREYIGGVKVAEQIFSDDDNIKVADIIDKYFDRYNSGGFPIWLKNYDPVIMKNLFQFSLFKCSPYLIRAKVYNKGSYMNVDTVDKSLYSGYSSEMLKNYISLLLYPQMTEFTDDDKNNCVIAFNSITHSRALLPYPSYQPVAKVTNTGSGIFSDNEAYHVTMLGILLISKWFDYLKENGIWDNTRIIIGSDHGYYRPNNPIPVNITLPNNNKLQRFNSLLMVKEFRASKELSVDSTFMTSADVPVIAVRDIIDNPKNPFTQEPFYTDKDSGVIIPTTDWKPMSNHGKYTYNIKDNEWMRVKENVFKRENWTIYSVEK